MTSHILHRQMKSPYPAIVGGQGVYLIDADGKRYLDASGGAAVSCLGHGHPRVVKAIKRQLDRIAFAHSAFFTNEPAEQLAEWLCRRAPGDFGRVNFVAGGSEAMEAALKHVRQIHLERGEPSRKYFIARRQSYHGATLGALAIGGHTQRRACYEPMLEGPYSHVAPAHAYRFQEAGETAQQYGMRAAQALEAEILRLGAENVAAFVAETVVGATMGVAPPPPGYFMEVRRICDTHGVLLVLDEVMCGMGRTGSLFAFEQEGIAPDLVTVAKGLGGGYQPIGAVLMRGELADAIVSGTGALEHGHTYMAHAAACAGALAVQQVIEEDGLLPRVHERGEKLKARLEELLGPNAHVGDIRGRGLFIGIELVCDRETKAPFPATMGLAATIKRCAFRNGLICYPSNGTADGTNGDHVLIAPPFIISADEIELLASRLELSISEALAETGARV